MKASPSEALQVLLTDAEDRLPIAEDGLPEEAAAAAPTPTPAPGRGDVGELEAPDVDPNDLPRQRWGVIAPEGALGDRILEAIAPLIVLRGRQQGASPRIYRVPPAMDAAASITWKHAVLRAESVPEDERPRYLLIVGDFAEVSLELQHTLANGSFVGRLAFAGDAPAADYAAYAAKVVTSEAGPIDDRPPRPRVFTVHDGTPAVAVGHRHLIRPCVEMARQWSERERLWIDELQEVPHSDLGPGPLLAAAAEPRPSVLLSLGHGLGAPRRGWKSEAEQRRLQGALALGLDADPLTADAVDAVPFLPGGFWFAVACFAGGTPGESAYYPWLSTLAEAGQRPRSSASELLRSLPRGGPGFVAALPQAALRNPRGPLAMIAHVDLAWTFGFTDPMATQSRASRIFAVLRALLAGARGGVALDALMRAYRETNDELLAGAQRRRDAEVRGRPDPVDKAALARLWMQRNDLRGYILLGDPAAALALDRERALAGGSSVAARERPASAAADLSGAAIGAAIGEQRGDAASVKGSERSGEGPPDGAASPDRPGPPRPEEMSEGTGERPRVDAVRGARGAASTRPAERPAGAGARDRELAVLALLRGAEAPQAIASRLGVDLDQLFGWLERYRRAGRRALR